MQLRFRHVARNVFSSWTATIANMAIGFFLAPFLVRHLGNVTYGIWVLSISSVSYLSLLDLGMRSSVLRFVSKERAAGDHVRASEAFSAALWVRLQIGAAVLLLSSGLSWFFPILFRIPAGLVETSRISVLLIGITTAVGMCMGVFGGVLSAINRYDLQTAVTLVQLAIRISGVVLSLYKGWGLIGIASSELVAAIAGNSLLYILARQGYPELYIRLARPQRAMLRTLWSYSFYVFLQTIAIQLVYQTDNLVVGSFVSASAVTFYAIGNSLCRYTDQLAGAMSLTFVPAASTYEASGELGKILTLYRVGTRAMLAVSLPILITLLVRGRTFIGLWMGAQYSRPSGTVLAILATAMLFSLANNPAAAIAFGTDRHRFAALWAVTEGITNLLLSIVLVHYFGIVGVAFGTLIPSLLIHLVVWPGYVSRMLNVTRLDIFIRIWGVMFGAALPFALIAVLIELYLPTRSLLIFTLQTAATLPVFALTLALIFRQEMRMRVFPAMRRKFFSSGAAV